MDWLLLVGLLVVGSLLLLAVMFMLRFERRPRRLPTWLPVVGLIVSAGLFGLSIVSGVWTNAVVFGLNMLVFSMLAGISRRPDRR